MDINNNKLEMIVKKALNKYDYSKMLLKLENEIELINNNIDKMYVDKLNSKISEEMYNRLFSKLKDEAKQKENEYLKLKNKQDNQKEDNSEKIKRMSKQFLMLERPTPEFMRVLINRIELHQDKQVDIIFNFRKPNEISLD